MTEAQRLWLESVSLSMGEERGLHELPDSFEWAHWLRRRLGRPTPMDEVLGIGPLYGVVLCGASGNGRHTTMQALAATMEQEQGYGCVLLQSLSMEAAGKQTVLGALRSLLENAEADERILFAMEGVTRCKWHPKLLALLLEAIQRGRPRMMLVILNEEERLPTELRCLLQICRFSNPTQSQRERYLQEQMLNPLLEIKGMNEAALAKRTEGFSYRQLAQLLELLRLAQREKIQQSVPVEQWAQFAEDTSLFAGHKVEAETAEGLIELLQRPAPAAGTATVVVQQTAGVAVAAQPSEDTSEAAYREKLNAMSYEEQKRVLAEARNRTD